MRQDTIRFNLLALLGALLLFVLIVIYLGPALLNKDPLWFMPFNETPQRIIVYRGGKQLILTPGDPRFADMTRAINRSLSRISTIDMLGPSKETIAEYRAQETCVEVLYPKMVKLKSNLGVGEASAILIPLTGLHTERPHIFTGTWEMYMAGSPIVRDLSPVRQAVDNLIF